VKVTLDRTFPMPAGVDTTWAALADIEGVASCMPGAKITERVEPAEGARSNLVGHAEATVSGKAATFGGRLMQGVADQILKQFAGNFSARVEASASATQPSPVPPGTTNAPAPQGSANANATPAPAAEAPAAPARPLNAFALLWAVLRDWLRGLFTRKAG
jgi:hypothetical protein